MPFHAFKTFGPYTISAGGSQELDWDADDDYIIKRIYVVDQDSLPLEKLTITLFVEQTTYTKDLVPCSVLGGNVLTAPELSIEIRKAQKFKATIKNHDTQSRTVYLVLELWKA